LNRLSIGEIIALLPPEAAMTTRSKSTAFAVILAALVIVAAPSSSFAQSAVDIATRWGMLGTWQTDCKAAASRENYNMSIVVKDGKLFLDRKWDDFTDSSQITGGALKADGTIELVVNFAAFSQIRRNVYAKSDSGQIRIMENQNLKDGEYSVRNGTIAGDGPPTPWLTLCQ
jgi:hypothetical protein